MVPGVGIFPEVVVAVGQQEGEQAGLLPPNPGAQLLRGGLVGVTVGVVHPGQGDLGTAPLQKFVLVGQHCHPALGQQRLELLHRPRPQRPLVVPRDVVAGGDGGQPFCQGGHHGQLAFLVDEVAGNHD